MTWTRFSAPTGETAYLTRPYATLLQDQDERAQSVQFWPCAVGWRNQLRTQGGLFL
jgi:hypothetical protein